MVTRDSNDNPVATNKKRSYVCGNGRYVVFISGPLVPEHQGSLNQVYIRDLETDSLELISVNHVDGGNVDDAVDLPGTNPLGTPCTNARAVSDDGRYVVFQTRATDVVPGVTDGLRHIYRRDRELDETHLVDQTNDSGGGTVPANGHTGIGEFALDPTGAVIAFASFADNLDTDLDGSTNRNTFLHFADGPPSAWTRLACFLWGDPPLVPVNDCTEFALSSGGGAMVFKSGTFGLVDGIGGTHLYWANPLTDDGNELLTVDYQDQPQPGNHGCPSVSYSGNRVSFPTSVPLSIDDSAGSWDLYVKDILAGGVNFRITGDGGVSTEAQGGAAISSGGGTVVFQSPVSLDPLDTNSSTDVYRLEWDGLQPGGISYVSTNDAGTEGSNLGAELATVSNTGDVSFYSNSTNLVSGVGSGQIYALHDGIFTDGFESGDTTAWSAQVP